MKGWILPFGGASSGRVFSCSLRSRLVFILIYFMDHVRLGGRLSVDCCPILTNAPLPSLPSFLPSLTPSIQMPSAWAIFAFILATYFLVTGGIIYDVIVEPPRWRSHGWGYIIFLYTPSSSYPPTSPLQATQASYLQCGLDNRRARPHQASGLHALQGQWPVHHGGG